MGKTRTKESETLINPVLFSLNDFTLSSTNYTHFVKVIGYCVCVQADGLEPH